MSECLIITPSTPHIPGRPCHKLERVCADAVLRSLVPLKGARRSILYLIDYNNHSWRSRCEGNLALVGLGKERMVSTNTDYEPGYQWCRFQILFCCLFHYAGGWEVRREHISFLVRWKHDAHKKILQMVSLSNNVSHNCAASCNSIS